MPLPKGIQLVAAMSMKDGGRGISLLRTIYDHPGGINLADIRREENKQGKKRSPNSPKASGKLTEHELRGFLKELVVGEVVYEKDGFYYLYDDVRGELDRLMELAQRGKES